MYMYLLDDERRTRDDRWRMADDGRVTTASRPPPPRSREKKKKKTRRELFNEYAFYAYSSLRFTNLKLNLSLHVMN